MGCIPSRGKRLWFEASGEPPALYRGHTLSHSETKSHAGQQHRRESLWNNGKGAAQRGFYNWRAGALLPDDQRADYTALLGAPEWGRRVSSPSRSCPCARCVWLSRPTSTWTFQVRVRRSAGLQHRQITTTTHLAVPGHRKNRPVLSTVSQKYGVIQLVIEEGGLGTDRSMPAYCVVYVRTNYICMYILLFRPIHRYP